MNSKITLLLALPVVFAAGLTAAVLSSCSKSDAAPSPVARGKYIVNSWGCMDCHTPLKMGPKGPERDHARAFSGHPEGISLPPAPPPAGPWMATFTDTMTAWSGPWGTSFPANLTPDEETGLGKWTADTFVRTIRTGRHMGKGRPILPPMPIEPISNLTDSDLEAVFAYLQSLPPIRNRVPEPIPPPAPPTEAVPAPGK